MINLAKPPIGEVDYSNLKKQDRDSGYHLHWKYVKIEISNHALQRFIQRRVNKDKSVTRVTKFLKRQIRKGLQDVKVQPNASFNIVINDYNYCLKITTRSVFLKTIWSINDEKRSGETN